MPHVGFSFVGIDGEGVRVAATRMRHMIGTPANGALVPGVDIEDQWAALERVYVQAEEQGARPKVTYIDIVGTRVEGSPIPVRERITP